MIRKTLYVQFLLFLILSACQLQPTRTSETVRLPEYDELIAKTSRPIVITENTLVLDARSSFEFGLSHISGSRHFSWESLAESRESGLLLTNLEKVSQRLSLNGLTPEKPILIVGNGQSGRGEEGRLAWSLLYYGFHDVQVASIDSFKKIMTNRAPEPVLNATPIVIRPRAKLELLSSEFSKLPKDGTVKIIDVRKTPSAGAIHLDWKQFYSGDGRPDRKVIGELSRLGVEKNQRIVLVGNKGVDSGAAAFALLALGYERVELVPGP